MDIPLSDLQAWTRSSTSTNDQKRRQQIAHHYEWVDPLNCRDIQWWNRILTDFAYIALIQSVQSGMKAVFIRTNIPRPLLRQRPCSWLSRHEFERGS